MDFLSLFMVQSERAKSANYLFNLANTIMLLSPYIIQLRLVSSIHLINCCDFTQIPSLCSIIQFPESVLRTPAFRTLWLQPLIFCRKIPIRKALHGLAPNGYSLMSSNQYRLNMSRKIKKKTLGDRAFEVAAPTRHAMEFFTINASQHYVTYSYSFKFTVLYN